MSALHGLTGRGIRIAVIDSGVNLAHPHICAKTTGVALPGVTEDFVDQLGHGTAVMAAIQERAPAAEYFAIRLFGTSLRTNTSRLIQALEHAIDLPVDVINLSLGTPNLDHRNQFEAVIESANRAGTTIVSASAATESPMLPGSLPGVIPVDVDWDLPRTAFRIVQEKERRLFVASGFPRSLPGVPPRRNLHGVSFAVANMTGFVALAKEQSGARDVEAISEWLASISDGVECPRSEPT